MSIKFNSPRALLEAYKSGFMGAYCDKEELAELISGLKHPLFSVSAYQLYGTGEGKLSLPFKALLKLDPGFGPAEPQETGDCYHKDTIVISNNCNTIEDTNVGDMIYGPDGSYTKVISKQIKISHNPFVTIKTKGSLPLTVTSDHKVLIGRKENNEISNSNIAVKGGKSIVKSWVSAIDIQKGDYLITPTNLSVGSLPDNRFIKHKDFTWFLGYFLGDGWCNKKQLEITFAEHQVDKFDRCKTLLEDFGFNVSRCEYNNKNTTSFRLRCWCPEFALYLRSECYDKNKSKIFPSWGIGDKNIVNGLIDSDGFYKNDKEVFNSSSKSLTYGVYYSYLKLGYKPTINKFHRSGGYKTEKQSYRVTCIYNKKKNYSFIKDDYLFIQVNSVNLEEGPHEVYDIGVSHKDHAFIANGVISHNCVSHGTRNAVDVTRAVEIVIKGEPEAFVARGATEAIYGFRGHGGEGMTCSGAAKFVSTEGGILLRKKYDWADLSSYNVNVGINWGSRGVPSEVKQEGIKHQVKTVSMVHTVEGARDALANGYAISVCSNQGFSSRRDSNGIAKAQGSWNHCMAWIAADDTREKFDETLFLVQNSWGKFNNGPLVNDQPEGSFWIRQSDAERMLKQDGSFVFSDVDGFEPRNIDWGAWDEVW